MDMHYYGLLRLAGVFGPALSARAADGPFGAITWLNIFSIYALANRPDLGTYSASQAAAHSLSQCLRAELHQSGIRVQNAYLGPIDDEWHQQILPPKLEPTQAAKRILNSVSRGLEEFPVGPVAQELYQRWVENRKEVERSFAQ